MPDVVPQIAVKAIAKSYNIPIKDLIVHEKKTGCIKGCKATQRRAKRVGVYFLSKLFGWQHKNRIYKEAGFSMAQLAEILNLDRTSLYYHMDALICKDPEGVKNKQLQAEFEIIKKHFRELYANKS